MAASSWQEVPPMGRIIPDSAFEITKLAYRDAWPSLGARKSIGYQMSTVVLIVRQAQSCAAKKSGPPRSHHTAVRMACLSPATGLQRLSHFAGGVLEADRRRCGADDEIKSPARLSVNGPSP